MTKTLIVSPSELSTLRQCPAKHENAYKERWTGAEPGVALVKGTRWHEALELHYGILHLWQKGEGPATMSESDVLEVCMNAVDELLDANDPIDEIVWWMYLGHCDLYGADLQWKILAVEFKDEYWLPTDRGGRSRFKLKCKIDLVVRDLRSGTNWIVDHKSGKDLPKDKELDLDDQFGLYEWAMRSAGRQILGTVHSAARTHRNVDQNRHPQPLDERFRRKRMSRTPTELETIAVEAYRTFRTGYGYAPGEAPRSPNPDTCRWRCDYTEPCLMSRKGVDRHEALVSFGLHQDFTRH